VEDEEVHVIPTFGPEHVLSDDCWCHPERDEEDSSVIVHNVAN
jgi:hypothetical protein